MKLLLGAETLIFGGREELKTIRPCCTHQILSNDVFFMRIGECWFLVKFSIFLLIKVPPKNVVFRGPILPLRDFRCFLCSDPVTIREWRHSRQSRRPSVDRFGLYVRLSGPAAKNHDLGKNGGFWGKWYPKFGLGKISRYPHTNTHGNTSFVVSNLVTGLLLLVDVGFEGEKKNVRNPVILYKIGVP